MVIGASRLVRSLVLRHLRLSPGVTHTFHLVIVNSNEHEKRVKKEGQVFYFDIPSFLRLYAFNTKIKDLTLDYDLDYTSVASFAFVPKGWNGKLPRGADRIDSL